MNNWQDVASVDEFAQGTRRVVDVDGVSVAVFNLVGEYFAIKDVCPHDGGELANGKLDGEVIVCPRHGARFSIRTGAVLSPPAYEDVCTYPVRVVDGKLQVNTNCRSS
jgi:3-phenylpropionate/trans-cinnamate dioxygenase ferredoxin subunit